MLLREKGVDSAALWISQRTTYPQSLDKSLASPPTYPHSPHLRRLLFLEDVLLRHARRYATSLRTKPDISILVKTGHSYFGLTRFFTFPSSFFFLFFRLCFLNKKLLALEPPSTYNAFLVAWFFCFPLWISC